MSRLPNELVQMGTKRNIMRELREYGLMRASIVGADQVLDFSLGNPSVPPPPQVAEVITDLMTGERKDNIHSYTSAQGELGVRQKLAVSLSQRFGQSYSADDLYLTMGAAAALCACFRGLACPGDEFILFAPFFTEYTYFISGNGGIPVVVPPDETTFLPDLTAFEAAITVNTKAVVINSPNNPSGVIYGADTLKALADILVKKEAEYGHSIYLISDEPYRELVFAGFTAPWIPDFYHNTLICYSYSKSLSLPGARIGYILIPPTVDQAKSLYASICGAGRVLGYVNAPSLFQQVAASCDGLTSDLSVYQTNRDLLYHGLTGMGFTCIEPQGTFYMLVKAPDGDGAGFCERAKELDLLFPPTDDFGCAGWIRLAFCTATHTVEQALPLFAQLAEGYGLK